MCGWDRGEGLGAEGERGGGVRGRRGMGEEGKRGRGGGEDDPREWPLGAVGWEGRGVVLADRLIGGDLTHDLFRFWMKVAFPSAIQSVLAQGDVKGQGGVVMGSCAWCVWGAGGKGGCVAICGDVDLVRGAGSGWGAWERGEPVAAGGVGVGGEGVPKRG